MKYTGIELLQAIKDKKIKDYTKIKVFYIGIPTKHILEVTQANLVWKPGEFFVGELWDDQYTFEVIEEKPKHIEEINKSYPIFNFDEKSFEAMKDMLQDVYSKQVKIIKSVNYLLDKEENE